MPVAKEQLQEMSTQLSEVIRLIQEQEAEFVSKVESVCPIYKQSAENLLHYVAFRGFDARTLQKQLKQLGLTRLANAEGNILGSLMNLKFMVDQLLGKQTIAEENQFLTIGEGKTTLRKHTDQLFGVSAKARRVRIMVTQPTEAVTHYDLVLGMVKNGMDCARVNCAHDGPEVWKAIIDNVRRAAEECNTTVKIAMDLAGPKIRTERLPEGPLVKKFRTSKKGQESRGMVFITLVPKDKPDLGPNELPVSKKWMDKLRVGDDIRLLDHRGRSRKVKVVQKEKDAVLLLSPKSVHISSGTLLTPSRKKMKASKVGSLPSTEQSIVLREGDYLMVVRNAADSALPVFDANGNLLEPGSIGCQPPEIVDKIKVGTPILFDDGKIEGVITETQTNGFKVEIKRAGEGTAKLKGEKGINVPTLDLGISGLTDKDKSDLEFVAQHADIVNFSYVNTEADVEGLLQELDRLGVKNSLGVILKIETQTAYKNLIGILISAMQAKHLGVMIARGDLALEVGWKDMATVQEGILSFCSAAHIPVVWATQVLEGLAKKGMPSRSEITDIASSVQAECVMLNKGPHIHKAISFLDEVLENIEGSHDKKEVLLPKMEW